MQSRTLPKIGGAMRNVYLATAILSVSLLLSGCTSNNIIRPEVHVCELKPHEHVAESCAQNSIEDYGDYALAFVEFDDQGWFYNRTQMLKLMEMLQNDTNPEGLILFVYVHGWQHNSEACDYNVACTREVLKQIVNVEKRLSGNGKARPTR